ERRLQPASWRLASADARPTGKFFQRRVQHRARAYCCSATDRPRHACGRGPALQVALAKNRQNSDPDGAGEMHRPGVAANEQVKLRHQGGEFAQRRLGDEDRAWPKSNLDLLGDIRFFRSEKRQDTKSFLSQSVDYFDEIFQRPALAAKLSAAEENSDYRAG